MPQKSESEGMRALEEHVGDVERTEPFLHEIPSQKLYRCKKAHKIRENT
jgi:hypothetical protein